MPTVYGDQELSSQRLRSHLAETRMSVSQFAAQINEPVSKVTRAVLNNELQTDQFWAKVSVYTGTIE